MKYVVFLALVVSGLLASGRSFGQQTLDQKLVKYKGNEITQQLMRDSNFVENPETGELYLKVSLLGKTSLLNGGQIYFRNEASQPVGSPSQADLTNFLQTLLIDELDKMRRDRYDFRIEIVIDEKGKLAYFEPDLSTEYLTKNEEVKNQIKSMELKLSLVNFIPAKKDGKAVPYGIKLSAL